MALLWLSVADMKTLTSWKRSRSSRAFSSPRSFGISTDSVDVLGDVDRLEHLARVGELRDHVGAHEARDLQPPQAGAGEQLDQAHLVGGGDHLGLVLEAVARADLADADVLDRGAHVGSV